MRKSTLRYLAVAVAAVAASPSSRRALAAAAVAEPSSHGGEERTRQRHRSRIQDPARSSFAQTAGIRLRGVPSQVERFAAMDLTATGDRSDFLERLRDIERQETQQDALQWRSEAATGSSVSSLLFWSMPGGILLVLLSSNMGLVSSSPALLWKDLWSALLGAFWLATVRPGMTPSDLLAPVSSFVTDGNARAHLVSTLLPQGLRTLRRIVVGELWSAYFRRLWRELEALWDNPDTGSTSEVVSATAKASPDSAVLAWLWRQQQLFWEILERGTKKVIQSSLQKRLQSSVGIVMSFVMATLRQVSSRGVVEVMDGQLLSPQ